MSNQLGGGITEEPPKEAIVTALTVNLGSASLQNAINVTEAGSLGSVTIAALDDPVTSCTANLEIQVDGQPTQTLSLYNAGVRNAALQAFSSFVNAVSDYHLEINFGGLPYAQSCRVGVNVSVAGTSGGMTVYLGVTRGRRY